VREVGERALDAREVGERAVGKRASGQESQWAREPVAKRASR